MKKLNMLFLIALLCTTAVNAFATEGHESGGGGDSRCQEFYQMASKVSLELVKIGQAKINETDPIIQANELWTTVKNTYSVVPGTLEELHGRQAYSDSALKITYLDVAAWEKKTQSEKFNLVDHELSVVSNYENDGQYDVSDDMTKLLMSQKQFSLYFLSSNFSTSLNGSTTIFNPIFLMNGVPYVFITHTGSGMPSSSPDTICQYLGFTKSLGKSVFESGESGVVYHQGYVGAVVLNKAGAVAEIDNGQNIGFATSITCK